MKITKESSSPTEVTLNIEMDAADEDPFIDRSYRRTVGRLNIPGFRKGKAPRSIVESYVGRIALLQEALDFMIPETLNQALQDEEIRAFVEPRVEITELEPVSFTATVPLEPEVSLGDFYNVRLEKEPVEVGDEQVDQAIERIRTESAPWEPVSRPVQFGDLLTLNVQGSLAGEQLVNDEAVDYIPQEENVLPFPGFAPNLVEMAEGERKDFVVTVPEDYPRPEYAGKDVDFQVEVLAVKEKQLAEPDDEFAKGVGEGFETLDALRAFLLERITEQAQSEADYTFQERSMAALLENVTIDASSLLVEREIQNMQQERERMLRNQRLDLDTYLSYVGKTEEEFQDELRPMAEDRLNRMLAVRKLAQTEELEVSDAEVQEEIETMLESGSEENREAMRRVFNSEDSRESIRASLLNRRVMERITEIVQGIEPGAEAATAESEPSEPSDAAPETTEPTEPEPADSEIADAPPQAPVDEAEPPQPEGTDEGAKPDAV